MFAAAASDEGFVSDPGVFQSEEVDSFKAKKHVLEDHSDILEPLIRAQHESAGKIQSWMRETLARLKGETKSSVVALVGQRDKIRYVQVVQKKREEGDERVAASRDLVRVMRLRKVDKDAARSFAESQEKVAHKLREHEAERRKRNKDMLALREHERAWRALSRARRFSLGRGKRLLRGILRVWHAKARESALACRSATFIQSAWRRRAAGRELDRLRRLEHRKLNAAMICYGRAEQRRMHRIIVEWCRRSNVTASAARMAAKLEMRLLERIVTSWFARAKFGERRRHYAARVLQHHIRAMGDANLIKRRTSISASTTVAAAWRGHSARRYVAGLRVDLDLRRRELQQRERAVLDLRSKISSQYMSAVCRAWYRTAKLRALALSRGRLRKLRCVLRGWRERTEELVAERARRFVACEDLLRRFVHGFVARQRFVRALRPYRAARTIQTHLARPHSALLRYAATRELHDAVVFTQRWRRGILGRRRARLENLERLFVAAYVDDADALIRRHTAAVALPALESTSATVAKHAAAGDLALHRAVRGVAVSAVETCLTMLGLGGDWCNDSGSTPLHVVGEPLEPPRNAAEEIAEKKRKREDEINFYAGKSTLSSSFLQSKMLTSASGSRTPRANKKQTNSENLILAAGASLVDGGESCAVAGLLPVKITTDFFGEWFESQATTNVLVLGSSPHRTYIDSDESEAGSIPSEASEREARLALMSAAEVDEMTSQESSKVGDIVEMLLTRGANLEALDALGRTPLMSAVERRDVGLVGALLDRGARTDVTDYAGDTPLTLSARCGCVAIGRLILRSGTEPDASGRNGRAAIHEVCRRANRGFAPRFARALLASGASLEGLDDRGWTPLAHCVSCPHHERQNTEDLEDRVDGRSTGSPEEAVLQLLLERGINLDEKYEDGSTVLHLAAKANRVDAVSAIIDVGDADASARDGSGETPLHIAARAGATHTLRALLRRGADLYVCDDNGNQAIHAACLGGHVETIETLVAYEAPLGCRNWAGLTPLGIARMYGKHRVIQYLLNTIASTSLGVVGDDSTDDAVAAWSRPVASAARKWRQVWSGEEGLSERTWHHADTGEVRSLPPPDRAEHVAELCRRAWPEIVLKRELVVARVEDREDDKTTIIGSAEYELERSQHETQVVRLRQEHEAAIVMQTRWRRLDAINLAASNRERRDASRRIQRATRVLLAEKKRLGDEREARAAAHLQRLFRGREMRRDLENFLRERAWWHRAELRLAVQLQRLWRGHVARRFVKCLRLRANGPRGYGDWHAVVRASGKPRRVFGIYEERFFPPHRDVRFYHNRITGVCFWDQPSDWVALDREAYEEREQLRLQGFTKRDDAAAARLQAIWKGRGERRNLRATLEGAKLMRECEAEYLKNPRDLRKLAHYLLYLHAMREDVERARPLYHHAIELMQRRGPDDAWLLCSYAVFLAATGEDDWATIADLADRGRRARDGPAGRGDQRSYDLGRGFFRSAIAQRPRSGWAWHNYALVLQLVYLDFSGAEESYVRAVLVSPRDNVLQRNFDTFLAQRGSEKTCFDAIRNFMTNEMLREKAIEKKQLDALRRDPKIQEMALRVQMAWRRREFRRLVFERAQHNNNNNNNNNNSVSHPGSSESQLTASIVDEPPYSAGDSSSSSSSSQEEPGAVLRWEVGETADGRRYYFDTVNGVAQWEEPASLDEVVVLAARPMTVETAAGSWRQEQEADS